MDKSKMIFFAMQNSLKLGQKIAKILGLKLTSIKKTVFADKEILLASEETVRNKDVYVFASTCEPVNENIMELLIFIDSLKRASAKKITIAFSYFGYARQDRKEAGRQPITARLIANLLETAGATKIIAVDLHNTSIQGFFNLPLDDLRGQYIFAPEIKKLGKFTVVSPDHGGAIRARLLAEILSSSIQIAIIDKRRLAPNRIETVGILGYVKNKNVVIIDDIIDTGDTIIEAARVLKKANAKQIIVAATHGIFSKGFNCFDQSQEITKVLVTDSIEKVHKIKSNKIEIVSIADLFAKCIKATKDSTSISEVYNEIKEKISFQK